MSKSTVTLSDEAYGLGVYASITGRTSKTEVIDQNKVEETEHTESRVNTTIANVTQYEAAKTLVNALRAALPRFATNVEPLGYITDPTRLAEFKACVAEIEAKIEAHNADPDQQHRIKYDVMTLPIGRVLDEKSQRRLCATVSEALTEARALLKAGDLAGARYFLAHRKNLAGLMPAIVGRVVQTAIESIGEQTKKLGKLIKAPMDPAKAALEMDVSLIDDALAWVDTSLTGVTSEGDAPEALQ